jgi:hypothetical protein
MLRFIRMGMSETLVLIASGLQIDFEPKPLLAV